MRKHICYLILILSVLMIPASVVFAARGITEDSGFWPGSVNGPNPQHPKTMLSAAMKGLPADKIERPLSLKIGKAKPQDMMRILIRVSDKSLLPKVNVQDLPKEKIAGVMFAYLKTTAKNSQKSVLDFLSSHSLVAKSLIVKRPTAVQVKSYKAYWAVNYIAAEVSRDTVSMIAALPDVTAIYEDKVHLPPAPMDIKPMDLSYTPVPNAPAWGITAMNAPYLWNPNTSGGVLWRSDFIRSFTNGSAIFDWLSSKSYLQSTGIPDQATVSQLTALEITAIQAQYPSQANMITALLQSYQGKRIDGTGVIVGIMDTGVDTTNPSLAGKMASMGNGQLGWKDINAGSPVPVDQMGHGTHVAGTIVGTNNNSLNIDIGMAPGAQYYMVRVFGPNTAYDSVFLDAAQWLMDPDGNPATNDYPSIINCSWGSSAPGYEDPWFRDVVQTWRVLGILPVFASGNLGQYTFNNGYWTTSAPATYPETFSVGARDLQLMANFSSKGPSTVDGLEGIIKPNVDAPGVNILSAWAKGTDMYGGGKHIVSTDLYLSNGTSMAAPHVAGAAALLRQMYPNWTVDDIQAALSYYDGSSDGSEDLYSTGTRFASIPGAARIGMVFKPSAVSLGRDDISQSTWSKTASFTMKNLSRQTENLQLSCLNRYPVGSSFPAGITCQVSPATITLPAMGEAQASFILNVDNTKAANVQGFPNDYSGKIQALDSNGVKYAMPFTFLKSPVLYISRTYQIQWNNLFIRNDHGFAEQLGSYMGTPADVIVNVPTDDPCDIFNYELSYDNNALYYSTYDQVKPDNLASPLLINKADAAYKMNFSPVDVYGQPLNVIDDRKITIRSDPQLPGYAIGVSIDLSGVSPTTQLKVSSISNRWQMYWYLQSIGYSLAEGGAGQVNDFYSLVGQLPAGIANDYTWKNDPGDFVPRIMRFHPLSGESSLPVSFGSPYDLTNVTSPFMKKFYFQKNTRSEFYNFPIMYVFNSTRVMPPTTNEYDDLRSTSPLFNAADYSSLSAYWSSPTPLMTFSGPVWDVGLGPYYFSGSLQFDNNGMTVVPLASYRGDIYFASQTYDALGWDYLTPAPITVYNSSHVDVSNLYLNQAFPLPSPGQYQIQIPSFKKYSIGNMNGSSSVIMNIDSTKTNKTPPQFTAFNIFSNSQITDTVNGQILGNKIVFTLKDASPIAQVTVSYSTTKRGIAGSLNVTNNGNTYTVTIPDTFLTASDYVSLVITAVDTDGNSTVQNLNPAFYYRTTSPKPPIKIVGRKPGG